MANLTYLFRSSEVSWEKFLSPNDLFLDWALTTFNHFIIFSDHTSSYSWNASFGSTQGVPYRCTQCFCFRTCGCDSFAWKPALSRLARRLGIFFHIWGLGLYPNTALHSTSSLLGPNTNWSPALVRCWPDKSSYKSLICKFQEKTKLVTNLLRIRAHLLLTLVTNLLWGLSETQQCWLGKKTCSNIQACLAQAIS